MLMKFFFKCDEAAQVCDKKQYKEASFFEKLLLKLHLLLCKFCRKYSNTNGNLTKTVNSANIKTLPKEEKLRLQEIIRQETKEVN